MRNRKTLYCEPKKRFTRIEIMELTRATTSYMLERLRIRGSAAASTRSNTFGVQKLNQL
jgi:hypothetical protein